jgi:tRNA 2-thiouridine synthesizing protein E
MPAPATELDRLLDHNGFMAEPEQWDARLAAQLARHLGLGELGVEQWRIIQQLREAWLVKGSLPVQPNLCRELALDRSCLDDLFGGPLEAWKIAGLPDPGEEARVYMEDMEAVDSITGGPPAAAGKDSGVG